MADKGLSGIVGIYVDEQRRVITSASDFSLESYGGCKVDESQQIRTKRKLAVAVVKAYCSDAVANALNTYDCEQIVAKLKGEMTFISIGDCK